MLTVVSHADSASRVKTKFEVVYSAELISRKILKGSKKRANDEFKFLQNTRLDSDDYCQQLSSVRSCDEVIDQAMKELLSGSNMVHVLNCQIGYFR